ncbi:MAG: chemotaxis response regulator protein-glutamate methylesterase [Alphaproteobacteria bacterium]|nr:chemotaxis response regulator protein-glutamate methylesterase [Alphaproteobacteria bacterium]
MVAPPSILDDIAAHEPPDVYRVMVVDDSAFIRGAITRALSGDPHLKVTASASNGEYALRMLEREPVDVVVLDIEMPVMDGLTALPKLKAIDPQVQIIMASTLTQKNAEISLRALSLGAADYIPKPSSSQEVLSLDTFKYDLVTKVKALGSLARRFGVRGPYLKLEGAAAPLPAKTQPARQEAVAPEGEPVKAFILPPYGAKLDVSLRRDPLIRPDIIAIGSSTGGPQALFRVIKDMGGNLPQPVVITQHMPQSFTKILAEHISNQCGVACREGIDGEPLVAGRYYIAPGDYHMTVERKGAVPTISLNKNPPENFCRPAVDPMLRSLVTVYGARILMVMLTGMGQDGAKGSDAVVRAGGGVIAQDEKTSVVWGMPGAVAMLGLCSAVLPLGEIGGFVRQTALRIRS